MTPREIDRLVLLFLELLAVRGRAAFTVERLLRMGIFAGGHFTVLEALEKLGVCSRALARQMERAGAPTPKTLLCWGRVLRPLSLYASGVSLERASREGGFSDQKVLSMMVHRRLGMWPSEWRASGGSMDDVVRMLVDHDRNRRLAA